MSTEMTKHEEARLENVHAPERYRVPTVDIYENEQELLLHVDLPGVAADGLRLDIHDNYCGTGHNNHDNDNDDNVNDDYNATGNYHDGRTGRDDDNDSPTRPARRDNQHLGRQIHICGR